ncbi:unnamed protein product [Candidula unifasciata]|uniref:Uncharacterized protein n=1 Tax=Candidula unifasciata TaxID=100452 RepID=A0A8S3ZRP3_9EUPU|nr:unnamed protein product [Candidula unifasciata]
MSVTRVSKTGSIREIDLKSCGKTQPIPPLTVIDRNRTGPEQLTSEMWATKIKDITSRLSRPTISSSLKTIQGRPELPSERDSQFWNTMAYCSSQYQKKFTGQHRAVPTVAVQSRGGLAPVRRYQPQIGPVNAKNTSGNSLPMLSNQRAPSCRN